MALKRKRTFKAFAWDVNASHRQAYAPGACWKRAERQLFGHTSFATQTSKSVLCALPPPTRPSARAAPLPPAADLMTAGSTLQLETTGGRSGARGIRNLKTLEGAPTTKCFGTSPLGVTVALYHMIWEMAASRRATFDERWRASSVFACRSSCATQRLRDLVARVVAVALDVALLLRSRSSESRCASPSARARSSPSSLIARLASARLTSSLRRTPSEVALRLHLPRECRRLELAALPAPALLGASLPHRRELRPQLHLLLQLVSALLPHRRLAREGGVRLLRLAELGLRDTRLRPLRLVVGRPRDVLRAQRLELRRLRGGMGGAQMGDAGQASQGDRPHLRELGLRLLEQRFHLPRLRAPPLGLDHLALKLREQLGGRLLRIARLLHRLEHRRARPARRREAA